MEIYNTTLNIMEININLYIYTNCNGNFETLGFDGKLWMH